MTAEKSLLSLLFYCKLRNIKEYRLHTGNEADEDKITKVFLIINK